MSRPIQNNSVADASMSEDEFEAFSDNEAPQELELKSQVLEKDSDEEELERLVLGDTSTFRAQLFKDDYFLGGDAEGTGKELQVTDAEPATGSGIENVADSALFFFATDREQVPGAELVKATGASQDPTAGGDAPAWEDSDDERLTVSLATVSRLRKLRLTEGEDVVSGAEYTKRLRTQYLRLHPQPSWARDAAGREPKRRRRSSVGSGGSSGASESDSESASDDEDLDTSALPLGDFFRDARALLDNGPRKRRKLRPETINIQKTRDIPDVHKGPVESLSFHPRYPVLLSSSTSSILHLNHIAPEAHPRPNPLLTSVQIKNTPIRRAEFLYPQGDKIFFAGRRRFLQTWDISTGVVTKTSNIQGHRLEQRTVERFRLSPCGRFLAMIATDRKGGGMLNVVRVGTMQWIAQARLDGRGGIADFCWWRSGDGITILGKDGKVGEWGLEEKRFVGVWRDSGSTGGTVLALGGEQGPVEIGGDRWVAVGSNSGILQVYDRHGLVVVNDKSAASGVVSNSDATSNGAIVAGQQQNVGDLPPSTTIKANPEPTRVFESLTTPITVVAFSPDSQLLGFGSRHKKDAFKLAHLPSCTLYRNWPTAETPLGRITAVTFGRGSDILAVGNDKGKTRLWEIRA